MFSLTTVWGTVALPVLFIIPYGRYRSLNPDYIDPLMTKIGIRDLDGWSVSHFCWYGLMGIVFPTYPLEVLGAGALWEGFEWILGKTRPAILGGFGDCPDNVNAKKNEKWWYGRFSDLIVNGAGFLTFRFVYNCLVE